MEHEPLRYAYFTGCVAKGTCRELDRSTVALCRALGIELWEMTGASCCGAGVIHDENPALQTALNARTLAMAEQQGMDIMTICSTCQQNLGRDARALRADEAGRTRINGVLAERGLQVGGAARARHLLWVLAAEYGIDRLAARVTNPLEGLRVAPFYGCQLLRPVADTGFEDPDYPTALDSLIRALGATPVEFAGKTRCCGFHILNVDEDTSTAMALARLQEAEEVGADVMVTPSPLCHLSLDAYQPRARRLHEAPGKLPVLHLPQLVGLACGLDAGDLGLNRLVVSPRQVLAQVLQL